MLTGVEPLAIHGGRPVRDRLLPYGCQQIDDDDRAAVEAVLRGAAITTGPMVEAFERAVAARVGAAEAVAVSSGTAALHAAVAAIGLRPGDEVILPPITFVATANVVLFQGATPVFADVEASTLLLDPAAVEAAVTPRTKAILAVDYAGQPCDYDALRRIADRHRLALIADACHALGATDRGRAVGALADLTAFSFHPVKHITTGEGGMVTTDDAALAARMRRFRNHGIDLDPAQRRQHGSWVYEARELGHNYRLTDLQCALGLSQLRKLSGWLVRRRAIAARYAEAFAGHPLVEPLATRDGVEHAFHLYSVQLKLEGLEVGRREVFAALLAEGIGVNVHYIPAYRHPVQRDRLAETPNCPVAEAAYERLLTLPLHPAMTDPDVDDVLRAVDKVLRHFSREERA